MPTPAQYFGGKKRFYYSKAPESGTIANWAQAAASIDRVLNPIDGHECLVTDKEILDNANSAQGQAEWPTRLVEGRERTVANAKFWLTPEAFARFFSSAMGADAKTAHGTAWQHAFTLTDQPVPYTIEEHLQGAAQTANSWKFTGCWNNTITIDVNTGAQFATITPGIVGSRYSSAGADQSGIDADTTNWPDTMGLAPPKMGLWIAPTTGNNHTTAFDGAITPPIAAGVANHDLGGSAINVGQLCRSFSFMYDTGVDLESLYQIGMSVSPGFFRTKPYAVARKCSLTMNFDLDSNSDEILTYFQNWADATPKSYSMQIMGVSDTVIGGAGFYGGLSVVVNAMRVREVSKPDTALGPLTATVTLEGMQAAASAAYMLAWAWDDLNQDYA